MSESGTGDGSGRPVWQRSRTSIRVYMLAYLAVLSLVGGLFITQPLIFVSVPLTVILGLTVLRARRIQGRTSRYGGRWRGCGYGKERPRGYG